MNVRVWPAALAMAVVCGGVAAQGFQTAEDRLPERLEAMRSKQKAAIGSVFWIHFGHRDCDQAGIRLTSQPNRYDKSFYTSQASARVVIEELVKGYLNLDYFKVRVDDQSQAYFPASDLIWVRSDVKDYELKTVCISTESPDELAARGARMVAEREAAVRALEVARAADEKLAADRQAAIDARAKKPGVRIGMTAKQVREGSNWGEPESVNRTITAGAVREQWVYTGGNYLYFVNGKLTAIQN